jgi:hypothetical protein
VIAGFGVILMVLLLLSFIADSQTSPTSQVAGTNSDRVAYLQFGLTADALWLADATLPADREELLTIPHAAEYGILPSLSPDGERFAYTALPEGMASPGPDSPAELWLASIDSSAGDTAAAPLLLAEDVDLLVPPLWTPDGESVVYRRSEAGAHTLATGPITGGEERIVAYSDTEALFPVGFLSGGATLLVIALNEDEGSHLYQVSMASGVEKDLATLSPGLTRDWALSPDGTRLAYLEIAVDNAVVASRVLVLDIGSGEIVPMTSADEVAFGPVWSDAGQLAIGTFAPSTGEASLLLIDGDSRSRLAGPATGFDVPLTYSPTTDAYIVSAFENDSITAPGRSTLTLVGGDGERKTITEGEVTLVGWTHP